MNSKFLVSILFLGLITLAQGCAQKMKPSQETGKIADTQEASRTTDGQETKTLVPMTAKTEQMKIKKQSEKMKTTKTQKKHHHKTQPLSSSTPKNEKLVIKVKGMVCAFCAQGIEKNFNKQSEVKSTQVNLDHMEVTIHLEPGKTLKETKIKEIVTGAGFSFEGFKE